MRDFLFILTHMGSGGTLLTRILNSTHKIAIFDETNIVYDHTDGLTTLENKIQQDDYLRPNSYYYGEKITNNTKLYGKEIYKCCRFIVLIREPEASIRNILNHDYTIENAYRHYMYRLRRLYEVATQLDDFLFITYDDLINNNKVISDYLYLPRLSDYYETMPQDTDINLISGKILRETVEPDILLPDTNIQKYYEKYLNKMLKLNQ